MNIATNKDKRFSYALSEDNNIMIFSSVEDIDKYVRAEKKAKAIKKSDCSKFLDNPKPFTGECYCIDTRCVSNNDHFMSSYANYIGTLCTDYPYKDQLVKWK